MRLSVKFITTPVLNEIRAVFEPAPTKTMGATTYWAGYKPALNTFLQTGDCKVYILF